MKRNDFLKQIISLPLVVGGSEFFNDKPKPYFKQLFFDGDSLFARGNGNVENVMSAPFQCYGGLSGTKPPSFFKPVSGKSITQLIADFPTKIAPFLHPNDIVCMNETTNELATVQNPTTVYNTLISYCNLVRSYGAKCTVATMTARGTGYVGIEADRLILNGLILTGASNFDGVSDPGGLTQFNSVAATSNATYYNADTLHFATQGYIDYGNAFVASVQSLI